MTNLGLFYTMTPKSKMVSSRLPANLVERVDFVVRNSEPEEVKNRSTAVASALQAWLPGQEERLRRLGVLAKKTG